MSCQACVDDVHRVLEKEPGVTSVRVDLNEQRVVVEGQGE
jgi:copper chaperone CopZ